MLLKGLFSYQQAIIAGTGKEYSPARRLFPCAPAPAPGTRVHHWQHLCRDETLRPTL